MQGRRDKKRQRQTNRETDAREETNKNNKETDINNK